MHDWFDAGIQVAAGRGAYFPSLNVKEPQRWRLGGGLAPPGRRGGFYRLNIPGSSERSSVPEEIHHEHR